MEPQDRSSFALSLGAAALLAACGGSQLPIGAPGVVPQSQAIATHAERGGSWMLPEAKSEDLLYVSVYDRNTNTGDVFVYSYRTQQLVGTLNGFFDPARDCVDKAGDVFITDFGNGQIVEYAHAGTQPIQTLKSPTYPIGCSVDIASGKLAVANVPAGNYNVSVLSIYQHAQGNPSNYSSPHVPNMVDCAYDDRGNLFVDGWKGYSLYRSVFAALPKHSRSLRTIKLKGEPRFDLPTSVQWDGNYLAVTEISSVVQFTITGRIGVEQGRTNLSDSGDIFASWIVKPLDSVVIANRSPEEVEYYNYPSGGNPFARISFTSYEEIGGVTVSLAPR